MFRWLCKILHKNIKKLKVKDRLKRIEESDCWPDVETDKKWMDRIKSTYDDYRHSSVYFYVDKNSDIYEVDLDVAKELMKDNKSLYEYPMMILSSYHDFYNYNHYTPYWKKMIITTILYFIYMPMEFIDHMWAKINGRRPIYMFPKPESPLKIYKRFHTPIIVGREHDEEITIKNYH